MMFSGRPRAALPVVTAAWLAAGSWGLGGMDLTAQRTGEPPPTFSRDISPLVIAHCGACHRPGGPAPFSLLTYDEVRRRARQIAAVTTSGYMPPWLPEPGEVPFVGERRLPEGHRALIREWVMAGTPEGDLVDLPAFPEHQPGWRLGEPDLTAKVEQRYWLPADGPDVYRNFVLQGSVTDRRYIQAVEFRPSPAGVVHHAVLSVDRTRASRRREALDPEPGYDGMFRGAAASPDGHFIGWTPGKVPFPGDSDLSWRLDPGADLVLQLHLVPSGRPEEVDVTVGLHFSDRPPKRRPLMLRLGSKAIDIPAGARDYVTADAYVLPVDVDVLGLYPHAHYLGRELHGWAILPGGRRLDLLHIREWDFRWQDEYRYATPIPLPAGTVVHMRYTFDNSAGNPRNPHDPPRRVVYGPRTSDEMGDLWLQVIPRASSDLRHFEAELARRELAADILGQETALSANPEDVSARNLLGGLYLQAGRPEQALAQLEKVVEFEPANALAHYHLGLVLQELQRLDEAVSRYRRTTELDPTHAEAYHAWGHALMTQGRRAQAQRQYRRAIEVWPEYAEAHNSLGTALATVGRPEAAIARYRLALRYDPDLLPALNNLGILLARTGRLEEAVSILKTAVSLAPEDPNSRQNLDAALSLLRQR